jgi:hypothetical protein
MPKILHKLIHRRFIQPTLLLRTMRENAIMILDVYVKCKELLTPLVKHNCQKEPYFLDGNTEDL